MAVRVQHSTGLLLPLLPPLSSAKNQAGYSSTPAILLLYLPVYFSHVSLQLLSLSLHRFVAITLSFLLYSHLTPFPGVTYLFAARDLAGAAAQSQDPWLSCWTLLWKVLINRLLHFVYVMLHYSLCGDCCCCGFWMLFSLGLRPFFYFSRLVSWGLPFHLSIYSDLFYYLETTLVLLSFTLTRGPISFGFQYCLLYCFWHMVSVKAVHQIMDTN